VAGVIEAHTPGEVQPGRYRRTVVAAEAAVAVARNGTDDSAAINLSYDTVANLRKVQVTGSVVCQLVGLPDGCVQGRSAITGIAENAVPRDSTDLTRFANLPNAVVASVCEHEITGGVEYKPIGDANHGLLCRDIISVVTANARAGVGGDGPTRTDLADSIHIEIADVEISGVVEHARVGTTEGCAGSWPAIAHVSASDGGHLHRPHDTYPGRPLARGNGIDHRARRGVDNREVVGCKISDVSETAVLAERDLLRSGPHHDGGSYGLSAGVNRRHHIAAARIVISDV